MPSTSAFSPRSRPSRIVTVLAVLVAFTVCEISWSRGTAARVNGPGPAVVQAGEESRVPAGGAVDGAVAPVQAERGVGGAVQHRGQGLADRRAEHGATA